jgi:hypothetical protein
MQVKLNDLVEKSQKVGLRVNIEKIKDLRVNKRTTEAFRIGEEAIERLQASACNSKLSCLIPVSNRSCCMAAKRGL